MIKRLLRLVGRWARKPVNHTSWVAIVTPTDRPKSVRNRCLIELFCGVVCVVTLPFWHFCWCRGFCHGTESDLFLFLLQNCIYMGKICPLWWRMDFRLGVLKSIWRNFAWKPVAGGMLLLQEPQQCIGLLVQWTSSNIICCAAKAFEKIGA